MLTALHLLLMAVLASGGAGAGRSLLSSNTSAPRSPLAVKVFHFILTPAWGYTTSGKQQCRSNLPCEWVHGGDMDTMERLYKEHAGSTSAATSTTTTTVALYNVHTLYHYRMHKPSDSKLPTDFRLATSEESGLHPKARLCAADGRARRACASAM